MLSASILTIVVLTGAVLMWPRVANAPLWRATITPLASIIGSGFLVLGPILDVSFGGYAPLVMLGLCALAYLFGSAIRYNIAHTSQGPWPTPFLGALDTASSLMLAFAFIISVAYYLNLFGAFGVSLTELNDRFHANLLTTAVFIMILIVGWTRGFHALERMEQFSVGLKLAIIAGLLLGLAVYFGQALQTQTVHFDPPMVTGWAAVTLMAGLLVTVQGFETSRYLGANYTAKLRIQSMKMAQWISTAVYVVYILFLTYAFRSDRRSLDETAIIEMMQVVAPILPLLLVVAALSAQFSAAVADTSGSGGLIAEIAKGRITEKQAYLLLVASGILLTWSANIFEIISYASRAFAIYYAIQASIAALAATHSQHHFKALVFGTMALVGVGIALVGAPLE